MMNVFIFNYFFNHREDIKLWAISFFNFLIFYSFLASAYQNFVTAEARFFNIGRLYACSDSISVATWSIFSLPRFRSFSSSSLFLELVE